MCRPFDGDLVLLHRLEQGSLRLGRCAVDFVRQQDIAEKRSRAEVELVLLAVEDVDAGDVGRQQVRRELHPLEVAAESFREGVGEQRFRQAGVIFEEDVAASQDAGHHQLQHRPLAHDHFLNFAQQRLGQLLRLAQFLVHEVGLAD